MKTSSLSEIKRELQTLTTSELLVLCMQLAKYKKENKEYLHYLLFETHNEQAYIKGVKEIMVELFSEMNKSNLYLAKKTIRKTLRITNKYIKYSGAKQTEVELLIYFCKELKNSEVNIKNSVALLNLYQRQIIKINKAMATLHEDLRQDYLEEFESIRE